MQQFWNDIGVGAETAFIEWNALLAELTETYEFDVIMVGFSWGVGVRFPPGLPLLLDAASLTL